VKQYLVTAKVPGDNLPGYLLFLLSRVNPGTFGLAHLLEKLRATNTLPLPDEGPGIYKGLPGFVSLG